MRRSPTTSSPPPSKAAICCASSPASSSGHLRPSADARALSVFIDSNPLPSRPPVRRGAAPAVGPRVGGGSSWPTASQAGHRVRPCHQSKEVGRFGPRASARSCGDCGRRRTRRGRRHAGDITRAHRGRCRRGGEFRPGADSVRPGAACRRGSRPDRTDPCGSSATGYPQRAACAVAGERIVRKRRRVLESCADDRGGSAGRSVARTNSGRSV